MKQSREPTICVATSVTLDTFIRNLLDPHPASVSRSKEKLSRVTLSASFGSVVQNPARTSERTGNCADRPVRW